MSEPMDQKKPKASPDGPVWSDALLKRRRQRAAVLAWVLAALVTLFFVVTVVKLGGNVANRPF